MNHHHLPYSHHLNHYLPTDPLSVIIKTATLHIHTHPPLPIHQSWKLPPSPTTNACHSCLPQNALLRFHGRSALLLRRRRLKDHARILHCMDAAISREGVDSLTHDNLKNVSSLFFSFFPQSSLHTLAPIKAQHSALETMALFSQSINEWEHMPGCTSSHPP